MACAHSNPRGRKPKPFIERFYQYVGETTETGCILWKGATTRAGYGIIGNGGRKDGNSYAHHISYKIFIGDIKNNLHVLHKCDNRKCINTFHLFLGTNQDNIDDKVSKERQPRGESHGLSKLTEEQVRGIKRDFLNGYSILEISRKYNTSQSNVYLIKDNKRWKHIQ